MAVVYPETVTPDIARARAEKEKRARQAGGKKSDYDIFKERYFHDPEGFARDCIFWPKKQKLFSYQADAMGRLIEHKRLAIRGPHGLGKTAMAALIVLWFALTRDGRDWKIPTLASAWRQLTKFLWPEIRKWARRLDWNMIGRRPFTDRELLTLNLKLKTGEAFAMASDDDMSLEGAHADYILILFDESKAIPDSTWDAMEGAMSTGIEQYWLAISTPGDPQGRFYQIHKREAGYEDWHAFHVTLKMFIKARPEIKGWAVKRKRQWGVKSAVYQNRVEGNFASSDEDSVIPLAWVEKGNELWHEINDSGDWGIYVGFGVDVGRGGNPSVIAERWDKPLEGTIAIKGLEHFHEKDIMPMAGRVTGKLRGDNESISVIDVTGIGAGVVDRAREPKEDGRPEVGHRVYAFVAAAKTEKLDESGELGFVNLRSAGMWEVRELLGRGVLALPPDDKLTGDLTAPKWKVMSGGRIQVESKEDIVKRLGRSTDDGDSVMMILMDKYAEVWEDTEDLGKVEDYEPLAY